MQVYIHKNNQQSGPLDESDVREQLRSGQLSPDDMAIRTGGTDWQKLGTLFPDLSVVPSFAAASINVASTRPKTGGGCFKSVLLTLGILLLLAGIAVAVGSRFVPSPSCKLLEDDAAELKQLNSELQSARGTPKEPLLKRQIDDTISGMKASSKNCDEYHSTWNLVLIAGSITAFVGLIMSIIGLLIGRRKSDL